MDHGVLKAQPAEERTGAIARTPFDIKSLCATDEQRICLVSCHARSYLLGWAGL